MGKNVKDFFRRCVQCVEQAGVLRKGQLVGKGGSAIWQNCLTAEEAIQHFCLLQVSYGCIIIAYQLGDSSLFGLPLHLFDVLPKGFRCSF